MKICPLCGGPAYDAGIEDEPDFCGECGSVEALEQAPPLRPSELAEVEALLAVFETAAVNPPVWVRCTDCLDRHLERYCRQTRGGSWVCAGCALDRRAAERERDYASEAAQYGFAFFTGRE